MKRTTKKLVLRAESVRLLTTHLARVHGGIITDTETALCSVGTCTMATINCPSVGCGVGVPTVGDRINPCQPSVEVPCMP